ncbi:hypothetical protein PMIN07_006031 [Paraphaeosphaeria minitans]
MPGILPPSSPKRFIHVRDLTEAGGGMNKGISVMLESTTGHPVIRKRVDPRLRKNYTTQEVASMRQLAGHPNIVQLISYIPANPGSGSMDELYLEHCAVPLAHGTQLHTLHELRRFYATRNVVVPEAFVWHLLEGLLSAVAFMHFGVRGGDSQPRENWHAIFHQDLHSASVFLSARGIEESCQYPRIVVGDFGCSKTKAQIHEVLLAQPKRARILNDGVNDLSNVVNLVHEFCYRSTTGTRTLAKLGCPEMWEYGEELRGVTVMLRLLKDECCLKDDDSRMRGVLTLLDAVAKMKEEMLVSGQLRFRPLLE